MKHYEVVVKDYKVVAVKAPNEEIAQDCAVDVAFPTGVNPSVEACYELKPGYDTESCKRHANECIVADEDFISEWMD